MTPFREALGQALTEILSTMCEGCEGAPDWFNSNEVDTVIDAITPALQPLLEGFECGIAGIAAVVSDAGQKGTIPPEWIAFLKQMNTRLEALPDKGASVDGVKSITKTAEYLTDDNC